MFITLALAASGCTTRSYTYQPARPYGRYEGNGRARYDRREDRDEERHEDRRANRYERRDDRYNRSADY